MDPSKDTLSEHLDDVKHADDDGERPANAMTMPPSLAALSEREYKKLGRWATAKMDMLIMPILVVMYILNYLDRQSIASAKLANIEEELGLSGVQYQTAVSILFCSYSEQTPFFLPGKFRVY